MPRCSICGEMKKKEEMVEDICQDCEPILIESDKFSPGYIQFESVSDIQHLNERTLTRGAICTSIDALIYAQHKSGERWIIPIEWKYTEHYDNTDKSTEGCKQNPARCSGKIRKKRYDPLISESQQLNFKSVPQFYFEPFYQLMRQTLWTEQIIKHKEEETLKADNYLHVHVIPAENNTLLDKVYKCSGKKMKKTWLGLIKDKNKYKVITPEEFMKPVITMRKYKALGDYLNKRYWSQL